MIRVCAFCLSVLFMTGCSISVDPVQPKPNVSLADGTTFQLEIVDSIQDTYTLPSKNGLKSVNVVGWHSSLQQGFDNSFGLNKAQSNILKVVLGRADLEFEPTAYLVNGYGDNLGAAGAQAQITYAAKLVSLDGKTIKSSNKTAVAKKTFSSSNASESVQSAIESMYELIANDFFQGH